MCEHLTAEEKERLSKQLTKEQIEDLFAKHKHVSDELKSAQDLESLTMIFQLLMIMMIMSEWIHTKADGRKVKQCLSKY